MAATAVRCLLMLVAVSSTLLVAGAAGVQLSSRFYDRRCPELQSIVRSVMAQTVATEPRMGASILRLFFHDCFVNGCDASILLDDTGSFIGEKNARPNANSVRGYDIIDTIKTQAEAACRATVSCADIVALAARDAVTQLGGPNWTVLLGRRDALTASKAAAEKNLPSPTLRFPEILSSFSSKGLDARDLAALSGAHTIGMARCSSFREHLYNDKNVNPTFAAQLRAVCPLAGGDGNLAALELQRPNNFDNAYFTDLISGRGLLRTDQELFGRNGTTDGLVQAYSANASTFAADFAIAMVKLGNLPLSGNRGEIRLKCRRTN